MVYVSKAVCGLLLLVVCLSSIKSLEHPVYPGPSADALATAILGSSHELSPEPDDTVEDGVHCNLPLGMSTGFISSAQITASGSLSTSYNKDAARLLRAVHPIFGWSPRTNNNQQYIQVDLRAVTKVTGVATQGRGNADQWVTSYKLRCSQNGVTWVTYQEHGSDKVFAGNYDRNSVVTNTLASAISCRFVRINPLSWVSRTCLRFELLGCQDVCNSAYMVSGVADATQMSATESISDTSDVRGGRLLTRTGGTRAWEAKRSDTFQYLQLDMGLVTTVKAVATQGRDGVNFWVKKYRLQYSLDGSTWITYKEGGQIKTFVGNSNNRAVVTHRLLEPISARYIRFNPQTFQSKVSMRAEVFACPRTCDHPLGLTTGLIDSNHVSSSSNLGTQYNSRNARLLSYASGTAWISKYRDTSQWIQVNFGRKHKVTGVATQGRCSSTWWVSSYHIAFGNDGHMWTLYRQPRTDSPQLFVGNGDVDSVVKNTFHPSITAQYVRVLPQSWQYNIAMKVEFYGCSIDH